MLKGGGEGEGETLPSAAQKEKRKDGN